MGVRKYKPTSPGRRLSLVNDFCELTETCKGPEKSLCERIRRHGGRNHHGKITVRHRGGAARRIYRRIDFKRRKDGVAGTVKSIEYDPNRTCHIALIEYADGEKRYILAPLGLKAGDVVEPPLPALMALPPPRARQVTSAARHRRSLSARTDAGSLAHRYNADPHLQRTRRGSAHHRGCGRDGLSAGPT